MAAMKTNRFERDLTQSSQILSSSSVVSNQTKSGTIKVCFVRRCRSVENKVTTPSSNPIKYTTVNMNTFSQRHRNLQPFMTQNLVERPRFTSVQPITNVWGIIESNHKQVNTNILNKKHNKLTPELSLKRCLPKTDQLRNIISNTTSPSKVRQNVIPNILFRQTNLNREYGQSFEYHNKKKQKKKRKCVGGYYCCPCSFLSILLALVAIILLGTAIAAIILGISMKGKTTTTTTTTVPTSTSTVTTSSLTTVTSTTTTTTSTTSSTTLTTTTTTPYVCDSSCLNQTWQLPSSNPLSKWLFDETFNDQMTNYNATPWNNVSFTTNGYVQQAAVFTLNASQMLTAPYMPLSYTSFTIETWLYITVLLNILDHSIFGLCLATSAYQCLHLTIRQSSSKYYLYLGFYGDDCQGSTPLSVNTWMHAAFVFDMSVMKQFVYLNGVLDMTCSASSAITVSSGNTTIGYIPPLAVTSVHNYFQGYIDQLTVSKRAKPSCEILEDATLAAYFTFDNGLLLNDSGPNSLLATTQSTSIVLTGHFAEAITFAGSSSSYFQMNDFTALGISNRSFSISLWIRPVSLSGVLVHVSSNASGLGWCLPFIGFATNGSIVAQILNTNGIISVLGPALTVPTSTWSHIVQTWSSSNGLRLYVNNILVASLASLATTYTASTTSNYVTLGNSLSGGTCGQGQLGTLTPYQGDIDDFRVYSRELNSSDVCTLYIH